MPFLLSITFKLQGGLTEATKAKFAIVDAVDPPSKPYITVFPKEGLAYDYRFVQEENGRWESWTVDVAAAEPIAKVCNLITLLHKINWINSFVDIDNI